MIVDAGDQMKLPATGFMKLPLSFMSDLVNRFQAICRESRARYYEGFKLFSTEIGEQILCVGL